ncbi:MAG: S41 family peptidase [Ignavibacteriales bacterium]|nr:S41 family peptidase [Ignavibacteriales bacterium]
MKLRSKILLLIAVIILFSGFLTRDNDIYFQINKSIDIFGRVYKEVTINYVDQLNPEEFMLSGINGMLTSLDPYTNFLDVNGQKDIEIITKGKYGGIGATVGLRNESITIVDLIEGFSAQRQGMRVGDIIMKINNVSVTKDNYENLSELLKGDAGSTVNIVVKREGVDDEIVFNLVREEIEVKNLTYYGFVPEGSNNAYLKLSGFSRSAGEEIKKALLELKSQKEISSVVLDLRGNPGGLLDAAIDVCEKFLKKGETIVTVKGRDSLSVRNYSSAEEPIAGDVKMALLIDEGSASASEIVAGAIQDHDRAVLVGTNSFGKGLVQTIIPLSYNTSLKITTARYYTPSGRSIQKVSYSEKNKVFEKGMNLTKNEFHTDHSRKVYSAGGIMPDTVVVNESSSGLVQKLLADGMFFRFATNFFNNNQNRDLNKYSSDMLLKEFTNYLHSQNFDFVSRAEKLIELLKTASSEENLDQKFLEQLDKTKNQIDANHSNEIEKYKNDILFLIREELAARIDGRQGRIKESLKMDNQFVAAVNILNNKKLYDKLVKLDYK